MDVFEQMEKIFTIIDNDDYRQQTKVRHKLSEILLILVLGVAAGYDTPYECLCFAMDNGEEFKQILPFENGFPSKDTVYRTLALIKPKYMEKLLTIFVEDFQNDIISLDGKTIKCSKFRNDSQLHLVNAYSYKNCTCIGQAITKGKGNELKGIKELLSNLNIKDKVITTDALSTHDDIIKLIISKHADFLLPVKENRKTMFNDIKDYFDSFKDECENYTTITKNHGKDEHKYYISKDVSFIDNKYIKTIGLCDYNGIKRYFISSKELNVKEMAFIIKTHWQVETMHQFLDITFYEDDSTISDFEASANMSVIRKFILRYIKLYKEKKGIKNRSLKYIRKSLSNDINKILEIFKI